MRLPLVTAGLSFLLSSFQLTAEAQQEVIKYKNPQLASSERTADLISRMTLEEKVGQLLCPLGWEMYMKTPSGVTYSEKYKDLIDNKHVGMFWAVFRADPWTQKTLENGLNPSLAAEAANAMQRYAVEETRLGIPVFIAEEAPHGHMAIGTTVFPTGIGMASTWNLGLQEQVFKISAKEVRLQGGHIAYGPVLDLSRDPRWSRVEEAFGEDPVLSAQMGAAAVRGAGAGKISDPHAVISTIKHFIAYGIPEGGHNGSSAIIGERELLESFLPPFKEVVKAGALSIMTAYNSVDGIPATSNTHLIRKILKNDWNFDGFVVSDLGSIDGLYSNHRVAKDLEDAGVLAMNAGVDVDLGAKPFAKLIDAVHAGKVKEEVLDSAVYLVLKLKFDMGLFENPYVNAKKAKKEVRTKESVAIARKAAQESIVLLENKNGLLPLAKKGLKIAVVGPNADVPYNQLGDYTAPQERSNIKTVLDGIKAKVPSASISYVKGTAIRDTSSSDFAAVEDAVQSSDVAVVVVGGSSARDFKTKYISTGAAVATEESVSDMESGEGFDRATLDLLGHQMELLRRVKATGKPMVVVYIQGRPLNMNWAAENADALLTAWYPGQEGGNAIADVLFGDYNPAGRLPISVPRSVGQLPVYYNKKAPVPHPYIETKATPLYAFGYGKSYSTFAYSDVEAVRTTDGFQLSFTVQNTGEVDGDEVAQLYISDEVASTVQPLKKLKKFERIFIPKGESKNINWSISLEDLSIINQEMKQVAESGTFKLMLGGSSDNTPLSTLIELTESVFID